MVSYWGRDNMSVCTIPSVLSSVTISSTRAYIKGSVNDITENFDYEQNKWKC